MPKKLAAQGLVYALGEGVHILLVALIMTNGQKLFGNAPGVLGIITFLALFVISAAVSGALVLGRPILLYLEGKKKDAVKLFGLILGWMVFLLIIAIIINLAR